MASGGGSRPDAGGVSRAPGRGVRAGGLEERIERLTGSSRSSPIRGRGRWRRSWWPPCWSFTARASTGCWRSWTRRRRGRSPTTDRGEPAADPRPVPGPARGARGRGARQRAALHGVPRRRRRAARRRGRGGAACGSKGSCNGCAASSATLELAIKKALMETAPDLLGLEVEGVEEERQPGRRSAARRCRWRPGQRRRRRSPSWHGPRRGRHLPEGAVDAARRSPARDVLVANVNGTLLAYRNACAACGSPLDGGLLEGVLRLSVVLDALRPAARGKGLTTTALQLDPSRSCARAPRRCGSPCPRERLAQRRRWTAPRHRAGMVGGLRRLATPGGAARARRGHAMVSACDLCGTRAAARTIATCSIWRSGASTARARAAGRCARATRSTGRSARGRCGSRTSTLSDERGRASGSRSAWRSSCAASVAGGDRGALPEPGRRDRVRAGPWRRGSPCARPIPCSTGLESDAEGADREPPADPPQYAIAPIDDCYAWSAWSRPTGRGSRAASRARARDRRLLRRAPRQGRRR